MRKHLYWASRKTGIRERARERMKLNAERYSEEHMCGTSFSRSKETSKKWGKRRVAHVEGCGFLVHPTLRGTGHSTLHALGVALLLHLVLLLCSHAAHQQVEQKIRNELQFVALQNARHNLADATQPEQEDVAARVLKSVVHLNHEPVAVHRASQAAARLESKAAALVAFRAAIALLGALLTHDATAALVILPVVLVLVHHQQLPALHERRTRTAEETGAAPQRLRESGQQQSGLPLHLETVRDVLQVALVLWALVPRGGLLVALLHGLRRLRSSCVRCRRLLAVAGRRLLVSLRLRVALRRWLLVSL
eukprot:Rhum_TRINITY_DN15212_c7_g1::Rhum_TRINITY_DN15212_c7_g1_i1::g.144845::m.144845